MEHLANHGLFLTIQHIENEGDVVMWFVFALRYYDITGILHPHLAQYMPGRCLPRTCLETSSPT